MDETTPDIIEAETEDQDTGMESAETPEAAPASVPPSGTIELLAVEDAAGISWTPFFAYLSIWVGLSVASVIMLRAAALDGGARWVPEYIYVVYAGIGMTALGPLLSLIVWLVTRARRAPEMRHGLFVSALMKGAVMTFIGAVTWIVALYVLDLFTSGILV